jgi:hypothetical protein
MFKMNSKHEKEVLRVKEGRKKRRLELEQLRRLKTFLETTAPEKLLEFKQLEENTLQAGSFTIETNSTVLPTDTLRNYSVTPYPEADKADNIQPITGPIDDLINEICTTHTVHLMEFDYKLFENIY